jgi:hypothetical protein
LRIARKIQLVAVFDPFGDDLQVQAVGHGNYRLDNCRISIAVVDIDDE